MPRFYDDDDFEEELLDDDDEDANAYEITMAGVFTGYGEDDKAALASARALAEDSIFEGAWEIDEGKPISEMNEAHRMQFEFAATGVIQAMSAEEALDLAAEELSDEWELVGDPTPVYLDEYE